MLSLLSSSVLCSPIPLHGMLLPSHVLLYTLILILESEFFTLISLGLARIFLVFYFKTVLMAADGHAHVTEAASM